MIAARIENGIVVDLWEVPSLDCYGDMYTLVEATADVQIGARYEDGRFINPPPPPPPEPQVPRVVSMRQARLALLQAGLLDSVDAELASMGGAVQIEWEYATEVRRDSSLVAAVGKKLGLSKERIDELFRTASQL